MRIEQVPLAGCYVIEPEVRDDERGRLAKPFAQSRLQDVGLRFVPVEMFYSESLRGVVRGMHFQLPPSQCAKLITCIVGHAFDVLLDLRTDSATYLQTYSLRLSRERANAVLVAPGIAHGFQALSDLTTLVYLQDRAFDASADAGVRYDSIGIQWPLTVGAVSARDLSHPTLDRFTSPFRMNS